MKVVLNTKGNGSCPLCKHEHLCYIRTSIQNAVRTVDKPHDTKSPEALEIVIYRCPRFEEK
jgi:hypothetical protein